MQRRNAAVVRWNGLAIRRPLADVCGPDAMRVAVETRHQSSACRTDIKRSASGSRPRPAHRNDRRVYELHIKVNRWIVAAMPHTSTKRAPSREQCSTVVDVLSVSRLSHACQLKEAPPRTVSVLFTIVVPTADSIWIFASTWWVWMPLIVQQFICDSSIA